MILLWATSWGVASTAVGFQTIELCQVALDAHVENLHKASTTVFVLSARCDAQYPAALHAERPR